MPQIYLEDAYAAVRKLIYSVWEDAADSGYWEDMEIEDVPLGDLPGPPFVVLQYGLEAADWGGDNETYEGDLQVWRIDKADQPGYVPRDQMAFVRDKMEQLRDAFLSDELDYGDCREVTTLDWDTKLPPNVYFKQTQRALVATMISVRLLVGNSPG